MSTQTYSLAHQASIDNHETFWGEQAKRIHWHQAPTQILDNSKPPFAKWFTDGQTNLCYNAVDRWAKNNPDRIAIVHISTETETEQQISYAQLNQAVQEIAAGLMSLGVNKGDRVLLYMPMIVEAVYTMLACARIGAIHSVVFGGFASHSLASRINDATPKVIVSADAGMRGGKIIPYKNLLNEAIDIAEHKPAHVLMVNRGLTEFTPLARDIDFEQLRQKHSKASVPVQWLNSTDASYILYTSGTTGKPKGVERDVGGYAVALTTSMEQIYCAKAGDVFFCTSDIGWVVGHSYIVYAPLLAGMTTIMYEGLPIRPDAAIWWQIVEKYRVTHLFSAPTAIRVLKKHPTTMMTQHDTSSLRALFLAGEPLDEPTSQWIFDALQVPIIDNYWQTETGWPILSVARGIDAQMPTKIGSPGKPMMGYRVELIHDQTGEICADNEKGVVMIHYPLPPGCMKTLWGDDARFTKTYWSKMHGTYMYSTFDWGVRDSDGFYFILGRTDDVINVAGHRLGTREIEESILSHNKVAEVAVVGIEDTLKGQVAIAFVVLKNSDIATDQYATIEKEIFSTVDHHLGSLARPARVYIVSVLPKTRSGKLLRRTLQAVCEGRDPGDITTIEDASALEQIKSAMNSSTQKS